MEIIEICIKIANTLYSILLMEHDVVTKYYKPKDYVKTQKICNVMLNGKCIRVMRNGIVAKYTCIWIKAGWKLGDRRVW